VGGGAFLVLVVAAGVALPAVDEVPRDFPASTLWHFRVAALGTQVVLWSSLGLLFGAAAQRAFQRR
jgi:predicted cobalt transporter CbtA